MRPKFVINLGMLNWQQHITGKHFEISFKWLAMLNLSSELHFESLFAASKLHQSVQIILFYTVDKSVTRVTFLM